MEKNPDKWIRKGTKTALGNTYPVYDTRVPGNNYPTAYVVMSTQTKQDNELSKCDSQWDCTILLDLITRFTGTGNPGDRVPVNDMEDLVIKSMPNITVNGFEVFRITLESSVSFDNQTDTVNLFRQLLRYRIILNEL